MRHLTFGLVVVSLSGCVGFVGNHPRLLLVKEEYGEDALRGAIIRAFEHRKITALGEDDGRITGQSSRPITCGFTVEYNEKQAQVVTTGPTPSEDPSKIDERCDEEATRLARQIEGELTRPERTARKAEKRRAKQDAINARNAAYAAQANLLAEQQAAAAQQYAAQQAAAQAQQAALAQQQQQQGYAGETPAAAPEPQQPPQPAVVQNNWTTNNVQSTTTMQTNTTIVNNAPPPSSSGPTLQPNTCCVRGKAYLCPSTAAYAAACVQHQGNLASTCPAAPAHDQFCPR